MPRPVEQDVHTAFQEFRGEGDKCVSVQCLYCREVRAKNTTRQRAHLLKCSPYLQQHPDAFAATLAAATSGVDEDGSASDGFGEPSNLDASGNHTTLGFTPNPRINAIPQVHSRPSFSGMEDSPAPKRQKTTATKNTNPSSSLPEIPLREVHAAFEEFKQKEDDKGLSVRCLYCNQVRAKNTSRQREHLLTCPGYQNILKEKIPANHLLHQFDEDDVARSLAIPTPVLDLDFRLSIRVKPKVGLGQGNLGQLSWVSCVGGQWAGRWGKGAVLPGGQDTQTTVNETSTSISARYLMQTNDEDPAFFVCTIKGWLVAEKDIMDRLQNPVAADNVTASRYRFRVTMFMETGDERYLELSSGVWTGAGCRRGAEIVYDFYRIN